LGTIRAILLFAPAGLREAVSLSLNTQTLAFDLVVSMAALLYGSVMIVRYLDG